MSYTNDYDFAEKQSRAEWLKLAYEKKFGSKIINQDYYFGEDKRKYNYDKRIIFKDGREVLIEEKHRRGKIPDLFVETHHIHNDGKRCIGWLFKSKADILAYASAETKTIVLIDLKRLQQFCNSVEFERLKKEDIITAPRPAPNPNYDSYNVAIPWNVVREYNLSFNPVKNGKHNKNAKLDWY